MAQLKDIFKVTQSQYDTLVNGGTVGSHTYDSNAIYLVEGSGAQNITYDFTDGWDSFTVTPSEGTPKRVSVGSTKLWRLDTRNKNPNPYAIDNYTGYTTIHLKSNSTIGITGEGDFSALMQIYPWSDANGGSAHQLAYGTNGGIYHRYGTSTWSNWNRLATREWVTDQLDDLDVDVDLSSYVDKTTAQTITGSKIFKNAPITLQTTASAGTVVNAVNVTTSTRSGTAMKVIPYSKDGTGIILGDGGIFIAGCGESATNLWNDVLKGTTGVTGGSENTYITSDGSIYLISNCQAMASRKQVEVTGSGVVVSPGGFNIASKATWQYNSSTDCVELVW